ncbi:uncharacterized protein [Leptinotarsa decemlineata]|uniref:uncharacterized protein n=1 Tax=Leptinotarsa decemlineata TaxID=7539 RepID=UPI000C253231|nr:uncharacterized protein LOC111517969 [Leptinotarsa decemlineata]
MAGFGFIRKLIWTFSLISLGYPKDYSYRFNNEYARGISGNTSYLKLNYFTFDKYNRTMKAANVEFDFLGETVDKNNNAIDVIFHFSIFKSNQYRKTPIAFPAKLCDILGTEQFDIPNITKNSTLRNCPVRKGHHYMYNVMLTSNGWPKSLPAGRFLLDVKFMYKNVMIIQIEWFLEIITL